MSINHDFGDFDMMSVLTGLFWGAIICALIVMCTGCTTTEYVTVEKVMNDTIWQSRTLRDSIYVHDSISVKEKGDTLTIEKWHTKYVLNEKHDTTYIATHDTIPQPYEVIKEVERQMSRREQIVMSIGAMAIMAAIIWFLWWAVKILRRYGILKI
jgi:hypothetical protein